MVNKKEITKIIIITKTRAMNLMIRVPTTTILSSLKILG